MIIWLNGAFGAGKTQTALELHSRISNSFIFDPEEVGFFLCKTTPNYQARMQQSLCRMGRCPALLLCLFDNENKKRTLY